MKQAASAIAIAANILRQARGTLPLIVVLLAWQMLGSDGSPQFPRPSTWIDALVALEHSGALVPAFTATMSILIVSFIVSTVVGFVLGLAIGTSQRLREWTSFLLEYSRALPPPVVIPVIVLMLGYSDLMKIIVVCFAGLWPVLLNTITGVSRIPRLIFDVARAHHLSKRETLTKIVIPAAIPSLLLGIRVALPHVIIITLVVEMFTGATGLGGLMIAAERDFNGASVFALLALVGVLGLALTAIFSIVEHMIVWRWTKQA